MTDLSADLQYIIVFCVYMMYIILYFWPVHIFKAVGLCIFIFFPYKCVDLKSVASTGSVSAYVW